MDNYESVGDAWPVSWSAVWAGALAALAVGLIIGLIGFAVGAHEIVRSFDWRSVRLTSVIFNIGGAFFSFVVGGWVAARIGGFRRAEPAILHAAIVWTLALPMLLVLGTLGATAHFGGWYGGLAGIPASATAVPSAEGVAASIRNTAAATAIALLIGLVGSVIGGWMASGEPMRLSYYRSRDVQRWERPRRAA